MTLLRCLVFTSRKVGLCSSFSSVLYSWGAVRRAAAICKSTLDLNGDGGRHKAQLETWRERESKRDGGGVLSVWRGGGGGRNNKKYKIKKKTSAA